MSWTVRLPMMCRPAFQTVSTVQAVASGSLSNTHLIPPSGSSTKPSTDVDVLKIRSPPERIDGTLIHDVARVRCCCCDSHNVVNGIVEVRFGKKSPGIATCNAETRIVVHRHMAYRRRTGKSRSYVVRGTLSQIDEQSSAFSHQLSDRFLRRLQAAQVDTGFDIPAYEMPHQRPGRKMSRRARSIGATTQTPDRAVEYTEPERPGGVDAGTQTLARALLVDSDFWREASMHFVVNGDELELDFDPRTSLLDLLRERLHLFGSKKGCNQGACGACTVLVDGERINSCVALAVQYQDRQITTIEGLGAPGVLHPLQAAFVEHDGFQCGYCTPGQICSAVGMAGELKRGVPSYVSADVAAECFDLTDEELRERMSGNLCRCGAHNGIVDAIQEIFGEAEVEPGKREAA
jgi:xanthine dehydrogenase YagT iron-sulfur-binding subunit